MTRKKKMMMKNRQQTENQFDSNFSSMKNELVVDHVHVKDYEDTKIKLHFSHFKLLDSRRETCFRDEPHSCDENVVNLLWIVKENRTKFIILFKFMTLFVLLNFEFVVIDSHRQEWNLLFELICSCFVCVIASFINQLPLYLHLTLPQRLGVPVSCIEWNETKSNQTNELNVSTSHTTSHHSALELIAMLYDLTTWLCFSPIQGKWRLWY